MCTDL